MVVSELERIAGTPEFFRNERHGDYVQRRGGVIQEDDRLRREHYLFLRNMESRITAYFRGNSDLSPRDLLRERKSFASHLLNPLFPSSGLPRILPFHLQIPPAPWFNPPTQRPNTNTQNLPVRNDIRIELPDLLGSPGEPDAVFPGALPPGPYTIEDRRPIDRTVPFNEVPFFEPGNQCHSPKSDEEDGIHLGVKGLRRHAGVRKWHNHKDKGELADGPRAAKLARVGRGYDVAVHGRKSPSLCNHWPTAHLSMATSKRRKDVMLTPPPPSFQLAARRDQGQSPRPGHHALAATI